MKWSHLNIIPYTYFESKADVSIKKKIYEDLRTVLITKKT